MRPTRYLLLELCLAANLLVVLLWVGNAYLQVPAWLAVGGRMHPLLVHFPLVLALVYGLLALWRWPGPVLKSLKAISLPAAALTAAAAALAGLLLGGGGGFEQEALTWGLSLLLLTAWWLQHKHPKLPALVTKSLAALCLLTVLVAGHQGASLTHGSSYLWEPLASSAPEQPIPIDEAVVFTHLVQPILQQKCTPCHNAQKAKGQLLMETPEQLLKGGKNGPLWSFADSLNPESLLLERIHLPLSHKEHMPPASKTQLTAEEKGILESWIKAGASFTLPVTQLPDSHYLRQQAAARLAPAGAISLDAEPASATTIASLNTHYCVVKPVAQGSLALQASFFQPSAYQTSQLLALQAIKPQLTQLHLAYMPLKEADVHQIAQFSQLRSLNLSFTGLPAGALAALKQLPHLHTLSLSGNTLQPPDIAALQTLPSLKKLYLWQTDLPATQLEALQARGIWVYAGSPPDTSRLALTPPSLLNEQTILTGATPLRLKHYIQGAIIRYTLDGTEPDSVQATVYKEGVTIRGNITLKAKAFKAGWQASPTLEVPFYTSSHPPDTAVLLTPADAAYAGNGAATLYDAQKGDLNFKSGQWLGYRNNPMQALLQYRQPVTVQSIAVSTLVAIGSYIMPPQKLEAWAATPGGGWKLLGQLQPTQPGAGQPPYLQGYTLQFAPVTTTQIKVVGHNVAKLPAWHEGKGQKGWLFVDEIFVE